GSETRAVANAGCRSATAVPHWRAESGSEQWPDAQSSRAILAIDLSGVRQATRGQQHDQEQCLGGKTEDDGRQHQRLRQPLGTHGEIDQAVAQHRRGATAQAAAGKNEQVDGIGQQRQPDDDLERARAQQQPQSRAAQHADAECEHEFHQRPRSDLRARRTGGAGRRSDWCASTTRIKALVPTTTANTPTSNSIALVSGNGPSTGSCKVSKWEVKNGRPASSAP